jgi:2-amino-4-hydroxy-6-hydroxymethyldihydropteridine diphosphokinase/dihydroneopterin aldolase
LPAVPALPTDRLAVTLAGLRFHALVGVLPHEREVAQPLELDVTAWPAAPESVLDYRALYAAAADAVAAQPLAYIEDVAGDVAARVLAGGTAARVRVAVRKPHVALAGPLAYAEVVLERDGADAARVGGGGEADSAVVDVALGSNLGDRGAHLEHARSAIAGFPGTTLLAASAVEETEPVGPSEQGAYLNQMLRLRTTLAPHDLLARLLAVEAARGRTRDAGLRWGPRTLDCDIVRFGTLALTTPDLTVPHPELARRAWWQRELAELDAATGGSPAAGRA